MYNLINRNISNIIALLKIGGGRHVMQYLNLRTNLATVPWPPTYQSKYIAFWAMGRKSTAFYRDYFALLHSPAQPFVPTVTALLPYGVHASFASKLCHMHSPHLPIYDNFVKQFYCFTPPGTGLSQLAKVGIYDAFLAALAAEYARVLATRELAVSIGVFRVTFPLAIPASFTDEKIIDSLIWGLMKIFHLSSPLVLPGNGVTIHPLQPCIVPNADKHYKGLQKRIKDFLANGLHIGKIMFTHDPSAPPIPDWFKQWCSKVGIEICFVEGYGNNRPGEHTDR